jgi:1-acyl-sn-glycerol-3-phosphate acyltransferase
MSLPPNVFLENPSHFDGAGLDRRDPAYIRELMPVMELLHRYWFRATATGFEHLPREGPALVVGNHSGGIMTPDTAITLHAWMTAHGADVPMYGLVHPAIFKVPYLNVHTMKIGGIRAHPRQAMEAFDAGAVVLVYPGGGDEAYRSYARRNQVDLMGRTGFIKLAMKYRAPIIPLVAAGGHETLIVLHDGEGLARRLGLDRRGLPRLPVSLTWPWGLTLGFMYNIPFPARIDIRVGPPIDLDDIDPADMRDRRVVRECYERIEGRMQEMLDEMVAARA